MAATYHPSVCSNALYAVRKRRAFVFFFALTAGILGMVPRASADPKSPTSPAMPVITGKNGWLFLASELRFLSFPVFWGEGARNASRVPTPEKGDPLDAIVHFNEQLRAEGIRLIVVPVPPKSLMVRNFLPEDAAARLQSGALEGFFEELRMRNVEHVDLMPVFTASADVSGASFYCKTDSHWSGKGCVAAAKAVAGLLRSSLEGLPTGVFPQRDATVNVRGDLSELSGARVPAEESLMVRQISMENGKAVQPDPASPVLLLGDSHTLVFHDFLAERAGLVDQLAAETGIVPDLIGTRGSGATAVRVSLLRRVVKDPRYLASKKAVVWCFAAREFTESDQGWQNIPLKK